MLTGELRGSLDDKGRMRIPNRFREELGGSYVLYAGIGGSLIVTTMADFQQKYSALSSSIGLNETEKQEALRKWSSTVQIAEEDNQGRFVLQPKLKAMANITKKMVFLGVGSRIEIWNESTYDGKYSVENIDMSDVVSILNI